MISQNAVITGTYDYGEIARSIVIAVAASYAALDLAGRVTAASGRARAAWLAGGAIARGIGIWAMHCKGMLAFHLPVTVAYHWPTVLLSLGVAVFASAVELYIVSPREMGPFRLWTGSFVLGGGIAALHYIGMSSMRLAAVCRFNLLIVALSVVLAIVFSLIALSMAFGLREETHVARLAQAGERFDDGRCYLGHALYGNGGGKLHPLRASRGSVPRCEHLLPRQQWNCYCYPSRPGCSHFDVSAGSADGGGSPASQ